MDSFSFKPGRARPTEVGRQGEARQAAMLHDHCWSSSGTGTSTGSAPPPVPRKSGSGVGLGTQDVPLEHDKDQTPTRCVGFFGWARL